jgi:hypothetical protein
MPDGLDSSCEDGHCTWQWNANRYPVDELTIRVRNRAGETEIRKVPNTGELVLPDEDEVMEIMTETEGRRRRPSGWRGPG